MVDRALKVVLHAVDFHVNFVEMPTPMGEGAHGGGPIPANLCAENLPEAIPTVAHRLMGDVDSALVEEILDIPQGEGIPNVHHHRQTDDFRRRFEVPKEGLGAHPRTLAGLPSRATVFILTEPSHRGEKVPTWVESRWNIQTFLVKSQRKSTSGAFHCTAEIHLQN